MKERKNSIEAVQEEIIQEFSEIGDSFDQYAYLIELACQLPPMKEEARIDSNLVQGCQSHVWLDIHCKDGIMNFETDSNTLIVKGILYLLMKMFSGQPCREIADTKVTFLHETAIMDTFESDRRAGLAQVIGKLQKTAALNAL